MSARRNLGRMRHRVAIMALTRVPDEGGGSARADTVAATVCARVQTASAREKAAYGQLQERVSHTVLIRKREGVRQGSTVVWLAQGTASSAEPEVGDPQPDGEALYVLTAVDADPDGRRGEFLTLACEQRSTI